MDKDFIISKGRQTVERHYTICPICGKKFYVAGGDYQYKRKNKNDYTRWSCSYSCYNKLCEIISCSRKI